MRPLPLFSATALIALGLGACAPFPVFEATQDEAASAAPSPALIPLGPVLAQARALGPTPDAAEPADPETAVVQNRADTLRGRAAALRGPVVDAETRARMQQGIDTAMPQ
jgi:hypothetical protein